MDQNGLFLRPNGHVVLAEADMDFAGEACTAEGKDPETSRAVRRSGTQNRESSCVLERVGCGRPGQEGGP